jgi:hypothetical protein
MNDAAILLFRNARVAFPDFLAEGSLLVETGRIAAIWIGEPSSSQRGAIFSVGQRRIGAVPWLAAPKAGNTLARPNGLGLNNHDSRAATRRERNDAPGPGVDWGERGIETLQRSLATFQAAGRLRNTIPQADGLGQDISARWACRLGTRQPRRSPEIFSWTQQRNNI